MPYLALFLLIICCLKTFIYGIYEIKQKQNKPGGIAVCLLSLIRSYLPKYCHYCFLFTLILFYNF